ncbi:hypothetical protein N7474_009285 [Penicillium riverlandense]|uniref:uncharacterized protein n=1 Tax=Penicillium riverlandense TaxID=1903569 RepID=UPI0025494DBB|nr:uncharacterized protein N7474_009285 [Penicillium riverlandense]KAJ5808016.1 hypothetical protein N7474_009285 [Penicillium riverlandense]
MPTKTRIDMVFENLFSATFDPTTGFSPITKTVCAPRVTTHTTSTVTTTSTFVPADVWTTVSATVTSTITSATTLPPTTRTFTTTNAVTESSTTSFFAACATNNIAGALLSSDFGDVAGQYISNYNLAGLPGADAYWTDAITPYDCCTACIQDESCGLSILNSQGSCYKIDGSTCSQPNCVDAFFGTTATYHLTISNGNCAELIGQNR